MNWGGWRFSTSREVAMGGVGVGKSGGQQGYSDDVQQGYSCKVQVFSNEQLWLKDSLSTLLKLS